MHLKIQNLSQTGECFYQDFFVGWGKEITALLIMKNFSRKKTLQSKYPRSIKMDFQVCNEGQGSGFRKKGYVGSNCVSRWSDQGSFHERSFFIVFSLISLSSHFFLILLVPFSIIFVFLLLTSIFQWGELNISWNSNFSNLPSSIRHSNAYNPLEKSFFAFTPQCRGWSLIGLLKEKLSGSKGRLSDNFLQENDDERWPFIISNIAS